MKKSTLIIVIAGILVICVAALASVAWQKTFDSLYKPNPGSVIAKAKCDLCHVKSKPRTELNAYGKLLKGKKVDAASLRAIESIDADKDKSSNIAEIKAGTLPGDPKSKPKK
ncbi:MAG: hypothetical protein N3B12_01950 [Armatimonadetes bacterium]|nr:hypothetical protein [Armatimonadota bacterium]